MTDDALERLNNRNESTTEAHGGQPLEACEIRWLLAEVRRLRTIEAAANASDDERSRVAAWHLADGDRALREALVTK